MKFLILSLFFCLSGDSSAKAAPAANGTPMAGRSAIQKKQAPSQGPLALKTAKPDTPQAFCIFGGQSGKPFGDPASFKSVIWKSDVVYAGGTPGRPADQQARLEILKAMREARGPKIAVAFEALDIPLQPVLDDYAAGKINEEDFLRKTGWQKESDAGFAPYRPIFDFIIRNKLRALTLNVPKEMVSRIERNGPSGLNDEDKKFLPAQVNISKHKKYLEFLKASFGGRSAAGAAGAPAWDNYLAAVSSWNEGAGARIADFINANPGWSVLVAAGNDRLVYNAALPASVKSRTVKLRQASFYAEDAEKCPAALPKERKDLANYIWYTTTVANE